MAAWPVMTTARSRAKDQTSPPLGGLHGAPRGQELAHPVFGETSASIKIEESLIADLVRVHFDLRPAAIIHNVTCTGGSSSRARRTATSAVRTSIRLGRRRIEPRRSVASPVSRGLSIGNWRRSPRKRGQKTEMPGTACGTRFSHRRRVQQIGAARPRLQR